AVIAGLAVLKEQCAVKVVTDSQYVQRAMTKHLARWAAFGWRNSRGVPVANRDLWERLVHESRRHHVNWTWVRGNGASAEQNRCDQLAQTAARGLRSAARVPSLYIPGATCSVSCLSLRQPNPDCRT